MENLNELVALLAEDITQKRPVRSMVGVLELDQAYEVQDILRPHLGTFCGRKIALNSTALLAAAELDEPVVGMIVGDCALPNGATLLIGDYDELALEPEFVAVIGQDVPAEAAVTRDNLGEYVSRFSMGFEILDKRQGHAAHGPTFVANNVFNAGVVVDNAALDWDVLDQGSYAALYDAAGEIKVEGENTAPQNPIEACLFVINHFLRRNEGIAAGEVILCGAHHPPLTVNANGKHVFSLSSGESVNLSISS